MGPLEKIVDQIRGGFNFGVVLMDPGLDPTPRPKLCGDAPAVDKGALLTPKRPV